jgi:hypothetical protein
VDERVEWRASELEQHTHGSRMKDIPIPSSTLSLIREAIVEKGSRVDGRRLLDFRQLKINLPTSSDITGKAEVLLGKTRYLCSSLCITIMNYMFIKFVYWGVLLM